MATTGDRGHEMQPRQAGIPAVWSFWRFSAIGLGAMTAGAALWHLLTFITVAWLRLPHRYQLEWMEGGSVEHVRRILSGRSLYAEPAIEFIAFIYTPLYFYFGAALAWLTGPELAPLRLISLIAALGCLALIGTWVWRETGQMLAALLAAGLFAASYPAAGAWFDLARVDSLFLLLTLAAAWVLRFHGKDPRMTPGRPGRARTAQLVAGLLIVAAYQTKQAALIVFAPLMLYELVVWRNWRTPTAATLVGGASIVLLQWLSRGWYWFYTVTLPASHELVSQMWWGFWRHDLLAVMPVALLLAAGWLLWGRPADNARGRGFYVALTLGMLGASWTSRLHLGGYLNVNMPAFAVLALLTGLAAGEVRAWTRRQADPRASATRALLYLACIWQLGLLFHPPARLLPTAADSAAGEHVERLIARYDGDVLIPFHGYLAARAGKPAYVQPMASYDLLRSGTAPIEGFVKQFEAAFEAHRFDAVVMDNAPGPFGFQEALAEFYEPVERVFERDEDAFWPISGMPTRPHMVHEPRRPTDP